MSKTKKKVAIGTFFLVALIMLLIPLTIELISAEPWIWACANIPGGSCTGGGCSGDAIRWSGCDMTCITSDTIISIQCIDRAEMI